MYGISIILALICGLLLSVWMIKNERKIEMIVAVIDKKVWSPIKGIVASVLKKCFDSLKNIL